jgi:hypothetical protein
LKEGQMAFFLAIDDIARTIDGKVAQYIYDRNEFIDALQRVESNLERELTPEARRRARRAV